MSDLRSCAAWLLAALRVYPKDGRLVLDAMEALDAALRSTDVPSDGLRSDDALEYDIDERTLVVTDRIGPTEFGAATIVARDVVPWFGLWAERTWDRPATPTPAPAEERSRE